MTILSRLIATFFYVGYCPIAPGTAATAVGVLLAFVLAPLPLWYGLTVVALIVVGIVVSSYLEKVLGQKDPGIIVIDEVAGIMVSLVFLPLTPAIMISGFFLFRAFDMFKIYPINKLEALPGGWGIMLDDLMAGVYTNIVLQVAWRLAGLS